MVLFLVTVLGKKTSYCSGIGVNYCRLLYNKNVYRIYYFDAGQLYVLNITTGSLRLTTNSK